jgi:hypothetical protein
LFYLLLRHKFPFLSSTAHASLLKKPTSEKRKFDDSAETKQSSKKAKPNTTSSSSNSNEQNESETPNTPGIASTPLANEYKPKVDEILQSSLEGKYFPDQSIIKIGSFLSYDELNKLYNDHQQNIQPVLSFVLKHLSNLDETKSFTRPVSVVESLFSFVH